MKDELTPWDHYAIAAMRELLAEGADYRPPNYMQLVPGYAAYIANRMMQLRKEHADENPSER